MRNFALVAAALVVFAAAPALAQNRCRVMDPTGAPLNVRAAPNGAIVGALGNGLLVAILDSTADAKGRPWAYIRRLDTGDTLGWVYREFIACF